MRQTSEDPFKGWLPKKLWSAGGREGAARLCRRFGDELGIAKAVGAKVSTVASRLRRLGLSDLFIPKAARRKQVEQGAARRER